MTIALVYLIAALCFVYALKGLAHPTSAQRGLIAGVIGMTLTIATTLSLPIVQVYLPIALAVLAGGVVGAFIALRIQMTALPQLVAAFHSLVGLAAVMVAMTALYQPDVYGILTADGTIAASSLIEVGIGATIGAATFSGSVIAFGKLQGILSGAPLVFRGQHALNALFACMMIGFLALFVLHDATAAFFWLAVVLALILGVTLIVPIGGADMPVVV